MKSTLKNSYVILIPSLSRGGAESMAYQYGEFLERNGHDVTFLLIEDRVDEKYSNVKKILIPSKSISKSIINLSKVKFPKDTIFISIIPFYTVAFLLSRLIRGEWNTKVIYTIHNNLKFDFGDDAISRIVNRLYSFLIRRSKNVYAVSESLNEKIKQEGINSKVLMNKTIHEYNDVNRNLDNKINFLMVGRLNQQKDYIKALDYFHCLKKNNILFSVSIYGEGEEREHILDKIVELGLQTEIKLHNYNENVESVFSNKSYNALLLSSKYEGFGLVLIEAISKGMYVVGRDCDFGPSEIITNSVGYLLPYQFKEKDVLNSVNGIIEHYNNRDLNDFKARYNYFANKSDMSWTELESYL